MGKKVARLGCSPPDIKLMLSDDTQTIDNKYTTISLPDYIEKKIKTDISLQKLYF